MFNRLLLDDNQLEPTIGYKLCLGKCKQTPLTYEVNGVCLQSYTW